MQKQEKITTQKQNLPSRVVFSPSEAARAMCIALYLVLSALVRQTPLTK